MSACSNKGKFEWQLGNSGMLFDNAAPAGSYNIEYRGPCVRTTGCPSTCERQCYIKYSPGTDAFLDCMGVCQRALTQYNGYMCTDSCGMKTNAACWRGEAPPTDYVPWQDALAYMQPAYYGDLYKDGKGPLPVANCCTAKSSCPCSFGY